MAGRSLARYLHQQMETHVLTVTQLSRDSGVPESTLRQIVSGLAVAKVETLSAMCDSQPNGVLPLWETNKRRVADMLVRDGVAQATARAAVDYMREGS